MKARFIDRNSVALPMMVAAVFCFSFSLLHHGWSSYDQKKVLDFKGKIVASSYENPHGMLKFKTEDKVWTVVLAPPSRMQGRGLSEDMLKTGTEVRVVGYPHLKIKDEMRAERITIGEKTTELR
jgi:hypothetical protein